MRKFKTNLIVLLLAGLVVSPNVSWAATATATVSATVVPQASITLARDTNSVTRGSTGQILFDRRDDLDPNAPAPRSAGYMYAPYRSETLKNWHVASIIANGSSIILTASVSGTAGTKSLADILRVWCGGFYTPGASTPLQGTATNDDGNPLTDDWEYLSGFTRTLAQPFTGTVPFNYRLDIVDVVGSTAAYTGSVTFTLTSS